eukprot:Awhi_evm1s547
MVLVVRTDLNMGKGKIAAQCCHATLGAYEDIIQKNKNLLDMWTLCGQPKIVVKTQNEQTLIDLHHKARSLNLACCIVSDAGHTQVVRGSLTVVAIGP